MSSLINCFRNRKGGLADLFVFIIIAFVMALSIGIIFYAQSVVRDKLYEKAPEITAKIGTNMTDVLDETVGRVSSAYENLKWITVMLIVGMALSILIHSFLVKTNPVFAVSYVFIWILAIVFSVYISNVYEIVYSNPTLASTFAGFFGQNWIFLNLPIWITVIGFLGGVLLFINIRRQEALF